MLNRVKVFFVLLLPEITAGPPRGRRYRQATRNLSRRIRHSGDTNARPGALLAALASNTPGPQRKRRHQEKEKKKKGEGLATGNQKGFG